MDLFGEGLKRGRKVVVIGEVKPRIYREDVNAFYYKKFEKVAGLFEGVEKVGVMFGYLVHPSARERAEELGLHVVASYER